MRGGPLRCAAGPCAVHSFSLPARVGYMRSGSIFPAEACHNHHINRSGAATIVDRL